MEKLKQESSTEHQTDEKIFQRYVGDLRLTPEDFDKKILDVGAGTAKFAKWAKEHGVSKEIYSLEPREERLTEKDKSVAAKAEAIPFADESFDLVVSTAAIPNVYVGERSADVVKEKVANSIQEMVRVLRPGGEVRLARVLIGKDYELRQILSKSVEEILNVLEAESDIEIEKIRTPSDDTYEYDKNHNPAKRLAEAYLIIIRKQAV